ncbi:hypothetical protein ACTL6P_02760 [Endozoicomonas acroporae]|uniref:hypothetical protein n=1 Tax=Endozoicomonas acroporae TaxID=1701104 RepID=UPI000C78D981|nr:hypothetical protein [Endozoicomonas acroporae]
MHQVVNAQSGSPLRVDIKLTPSFSMAFEWNHEEHKEHEGKENLFFVLFVLFVFFVVPSLTTRRGEYTLNVYPKRVTYSTTLRNVYPEKRN